MFAAGSSSQSVAIVGAGIIGLACALDLADRGARVSLFEDQWPPHGASWAAAGMLAPAFEAAAEPGTHPDLFRFCDASARLWQDWAARLEARTGLSSGYVAGPSLAIAQSLAQATHLAEVRAKLSDQSDAPEDCLDRLPTVEPAIGGTIQAALLLPSDGQADNRQTVAALIAALSDHPNVEIHQAIAPLKLRAGRLELAEHDAVLIAAGWRSGEVLVESGGQNVRLGDLDPSFAPLDHYGGQMLSLAPVSDGPRLTIRCGDLYIVPKTDRIIVGATTEPGRALSVPDPDVIESLRQRAIAICPALRDAATIESWAGIRPGTDDHAPLLGRAQLPGLFVATGHYRNGILLAPLTAQIMANLILDGEIDEIGRAFSPQRSLVEQF